ATFGHQDTGTWQTRRVVLNEFHITQWNAMAQRHTHAVTGYNTAVGVVAINATRTTCSHNYCVSTDLYQRAFHHVHCYQAANMTIIDQNIQHEMFVKTLDLRELQRGLEHRVQHIEAGLIGGEPCTLDFYHAYARYVDDT